jgi:cation:H+ antiporter
MLTASIVFLIVGFGVLLYAGDCLVRGALAAAYKTNVSPLLVGILIVGFGTSLPEFFIAISGATSGNFGMAHGNIIGSNIANIWLVLALPAIIFPVHTTAPRMRLTGLTMLAATIAWIGVTVFWQLDTLVGYAFLGALALYAIIAWSFSRTDTTEDTPEEKSWMSMKTWKMVNLIAIGLIGLPLGSRLLIDGGISIAKTTPLSEEAIGLTILAVGSSLPEIGAGIAAAVRKQSDVAMGNVLGSCIFNILGAGGAIALINPHTVSSSFHAYSDWAMGASALMIMVVLLLRRRVGWLTGTFFLALYALYVYGLVQGWSIGDLKSLVLQPAAG